MSAAAPDAGERSFIARALNVDNRELRGLVLAFGLLFFMFASYALMRPVRETMGITGGFENIPYLFWGTFFVMLAVQPVYGWLTSRFRRTQFLPWVYLFFVVNILAFYLWFNAQEDHTWIARVYYVWLSVFNLFVVAVFWSLMADIFTREQAGRMFAAIAAGASTGGLVGPALARALVGSIGTVNLLLVSVALLITALVFLRLLTRWHREYGTRQDSAADVDRALGGSALASFRQVVSSPYLLGIATFVFLLTWISTLVYLEQQEMVAERFATRDERTAFFATLDIVVQGSSLFIQIFLFSRLQKWFGFRALLVSIPVLMTFGYMAIGLFPVFAVVIGVMTIRRIGEYAITRPCRDTLFTTVTREEKYKAKSLIDTFIYRGGDATSGTVHKGLSALGFETSGIGWAGAVVGAIWVWVAQSLGRKHEATRGTASASAAATT